MFPGTSTIQTRARYFLFVPWIYARLEKKQVGSKDIATRARREEIELIEALAESGEREGVIGIEARKALKLFLSAVYWNGLASWGIRRFSGPQDQYHRSLDRFYRLTGRGARNDDDEPIEGGVRRNWDAGLPSAPARFPEGMKLPLQSAEAEYLAERIVATHPTRLLQLWPRTTAPGSPAPSPGKHPSQGSFTARHREQLQHARLFSENVHGAPLLYNLMLAERAGNKDREEQYQEDLMAWAGRIERASEAIANWDQSRFWRLVVEGGGRVGLGTEDSSHTGSLWHLPSSQAKGMTKSKAARQLIAQREKALKGEQARLTNQRALERWNGAAGTGRMTTGGGARRRSSSTSSKAWRGAQDHA